jgi:hypothetical protein
MLVKNSSNKFSKRRSLILKKESKLLWESLKTLEISSQSLNRLTRNSKKKLLPSLSQLVSQRRMKKKLRKSQQMLATSWARKVSQNFGQKL